MRNHLPQAPQGTQLTNGIHADELTGADVPDALAETFGYKIKRKLLGPPLVNEQMSEQRLSKFFRWFMYSGGAYYKDVRVPQVVTLTLDGRKTPMSPSTTSVQGRSALPHWLTR